MSLHHSRPQPFPRVSYFAAVPRKLSRGNVKRDWLPDESNKIAPRRKAEIMKTQERRAPRRAANRRVSTTFVESNSFACR